MKKIARISFLLVLFINLKSLSFSQPCTWLGVADTAWNNPVNWSCGKVPDSTTLVSIGSGTPYEAYVPENANIKIWSLDICSMHYTMDSAKLFLMNAYNALAGDQGYGTRLSLYYTVDTDETMGPTGTINVEDRRALAHYSLTSVNSEIRQPFLRLYAGIDRTNYCIRYISNMINSNYGTPLEQARLKRMYGEALVLKAQFYFELIRNWGDVPYIEAIKCPSQLIYNYWWMGNTNTDRDTTYKKILIDLDSAKIFLPWRSELTALGDTLDERITKGAAIALRARIALFAGGYSLRQDKTRKRVANYLDYYQIAKQECQTLINKVDEHALNPDYKSLWKNTVCAHKVDDGFGEIIFQVAMDGGYSLMDSRLGYYNGPRSFGTTVWGNASLAMLPTYFYLFDSVDKRRDVTNAPYDFTAGTFTKIGQRATLIRDGKFRADWIVPGFADPLQYTGVNWPLIRYSDVLLMFAEADNELNSGPSADAITAFEAVRKRGYGIDNDKIGITPVDKIGFFNAIVKERSKEFGGEGIRKYDLIRWNLLETKLNEAKANLNLFGNFSAPYNSVPVSMYYFSNSTADNSSMWANSFYYPSPASTPVGTTKITWNSNAFITTMLTYFGVSFTPDKNELLPYHIDILTSNPGLLQNPGFQQ